MTTRGRFRDAMFALILVGSTIGGLAMLVWAYQEGDFILSVGGVGILTLTYAYFEERQRAVRLERNVENQS